jgi:hypothetical protein
MLARFASIGSLTNPNMLIGLQDLSFPSLQACSSASTSPALLARLRSEVEALL